MVAGQMADAESGRICYTLASKTFQHGENEMKLTRMVLTGGLLLVLAGCGNDSPVVTPPTTNPPVTNPPVITPPVTPPTTPPTTPGTGSISGTVTAPAGGDLTGTVVGACLQSDTACASPIVVQVDSTGTYSITGLQAAPYVVIALKDVDASGTVSNGDYLGGYSTDNVNLTPVTPPITGINFALQVYSDSSTPTNPTDPTQPPTTDVPYYGEWAWSFDRTSDFSFHDEGRFSIVEVSDSAPAGSGFGYYQDCYEGTCYDSLEGGVVMGPGEDNSLTITMFKTNSANDLVATYEAVDDDGELAEDDQGRQVFEGEATQYDITSNDNARGDFTAILTDLPVTFPPANQNPNTNGGEVTQSIVAKALRAAESFLKR